MLKTLARLFTLKPYGDQLVDGMAEVWLLFARLNIVSIALCDAVAWAYFGYTTSRGAPAWISAAVAGVIVFTLVASLDAMFIMHDRSRHRREASEEPSLPATGAWQWLRRNVHRDHVAIGARIVLVILTFTVTAPFLTQLFFARDIEANIKRRNELTISARRAEVVAQLDRRVAGLRTQLTGRQRDLEREIAGSGASGRYGEGPTAAAIGREIGELRTALASAEGAKQAEVRMFDQAMGSPELLASRYGVDLVREGPDVRARVIADMEQSPSFRATRRTIKAFLVFMFLGLVCLKLFQPESVRIYYSARLQSAYSRMRAGIFNHRLDPREHPEQGGMNPIRFADWYENDQHVRDATDRLRDQTASAIERLKAQEDAVRVLHETLRSDIARTREELAAAAATGEELEQQILAARHELNSRKARIAEDQQTLDDFRYDFAEDLSLRDQQLLLGSRSKTAQRLADHRAAADALTATLSRLTHRLEANRACENELRASLGAAGTEVTALADALQRSRQRRLADILSAE